MRSIYFVSSVVLLGIIVIDCVTAAPQSNNNIDFSADRKDDVDRYAQLIDSLCKDRPENEYFRLTADTNCRLGFYDLISYHSCMVVPKMNYYPTL